MFPLNTTQDELRAQIGAMSDAEFARFMYCQHILATYMAIAQFEDQLVAAMLMCDRVKVRDALGPDAERWERLLARQHMLRSSTLGSLIRILERHAIPAEDIGYLKWLQTKRDYFIHRLFHDGAWPGDLHPHDARFMTRRLIAIQHWLDRGKRRIWFIFKRANLLHVKDLGAAGLLAMNPNLFEDDGI